MARSAEQFTGLFRSLRNLRAGRPVAPASYPIGLFATFGHSVFQQNIQCAQVALFAEALHLGDAGRAITEWRRNSSRLEMSEMWISTTGTSMHSTASCSA